MEELNKGVSTAMQQILNDESLGEFSDRYVAIEIINKYELASRQESDKSWEEYLLGLLTTIVGDIRNQRGTASRALSVIGDAKNLKYLSSDYTPDEEDYMKKSRMASILNNINMLIRLASKETSGIAYNNLQKLKTMVKEEMYEEI